MKPLWDSDDCQLWNEELAGYETCIRRQDSELLLKRDRWYRGDLPGLIAARPEPYVTRDELVWVVEWKMARGVWRARNLHLARSNQPDEVREVSRTAFAAVKSAEASRGVDRCAPTKPAGAIEAPLELLGRLKGVGPATASAVLAAYRPDSFPFFDDLVAEQMPGLSPGEFTLKAYLAYAAALRARAAELVGSCSDRAWTAQDVGMALWASAGGKAGATRG